MAVYRIHWLRAKARAARWGEELNITSHEMVWTRRYFEGRAEKWLELVKGPMSVTEGHTCYALRQALFWTKLARVSWSVFKEINRDVQQVFGA